METCEAHAQLITDIAVIKTKLEHIENKICNHVVEGEKEGGWRDRLLVIEQQVSAIKKAEWSRVMGAGIIGGLLGNLTPELINFLLKCVFAGQ